MYNSAVRIGNWFEDLEIEKEKTINFIKKRREGNLLVQETRRLFDNLLKETRLSDNNDFIKFGNCIQLKNPDIPRFPPSRYPRDNSDDDNGLVVAATVHEKHLGIVSSLVNDCRLIASPIFIPCARNCFVIKSSDSYDRNGHNLLFGQEFVLQIANSEDEPLYIRAEIPRVDGAHGPLEHILLTLSYIKDRYCIWKVMNWNKNMRFESEGAPFPPFTRIVMRHLMSGLDLAVESTVWYLSIFGNECGISVNTYVDNSKQETAECAWIFVTSESNQSFVCNS